MMKIFFSASTGGFYTEKSHGPRFVDDKPNPDTKIPADAVEITPQQRDELLAGQARGRIISATDDGNPCLVDPAPRPVSDVAQRKRRDIEDALAEALAAGMPYTMPDDSEDTVQMLAEDRQNLMGIAIDARDLKAVGVTDAVQEFRGLSNTRYPMTPSETIALTDAALGYYRELKARSWDRKDAIDAALSDDTMTEDEKRAAIEAIEW